MKINRYLFLSLFFATLFCFESCSSDVDIYADYKEITVIYGLLDAKVDTNYIKINKAFLGPGNALQIAQEEDSCLYPGKLNARIVEYITYGWNNTQVQGRVIPLDTITIHNKKPGVFYAPDQLVYYTAQPFFTNTVNPNTGSVFEKFKYVLEVEVNDSLITSSTDIVGGETFGITTGALNFDNNGAETSKVSWFPCPNADVYDMEFRFYFTEIGPSHDSVRRCMTWKLGTHNTNDLTLNHNTYSLTYKKALFFNYLAMFLGSDTLNTNVERVFFEPSLEIFMAAGGEELNNYISVNGPSSSLVQSIPEYTNIEGGYGVFSSRTTLSKRVPLSGQTIPMLINREHWRFRQGR